MKELATFAGGCFWCMVKPFDSYEGIFRVTSGYMGGELKNPTYEQVKRGDTGHLEVVQIEFDPAVFPYTTLLEIYWAQVDPTDAGGQFQDRGEQYTTAIFVHTDEQAELAIASKEQVAASGRFTKPIVTNIRAAEVFYPAEAYHQDFYKKDAASYEADRAQSGRDAFIDAHWKND